MAIKEPLWVIRSCEVVKKVCGLFQTQGLPYGAHQPSDLPNTRRVSDYPSFSHVGLDFDGPIYFDSKDTDTNNKRFPKKLCFYFYMFINKSSRSRTLSQFKRSLLPLSILKIFKSIDLSFEELRTILVEIDTVINLRLVSYVYDDVDSISYPLTLFDLVHGRRISSTPNSAQQEKALLEELTIIEICYLN